VIDTKIKQLTEKWKTVKSTNADKVSKELTLLSKKSYEIKIAEFYKYEKEGNKINKGISVLESKIDNYIDHIKRGVYKTLDADKIQKIIDKLVLAKDFPLEKMQIAFDKLETEAEGMKQDAARMKRDAERMKQDAEEKKRAEKKKRDDKIMAVVAFMDEYWLGLTVAGVILFVVFGSLMGF